MYYYSFRIILVIRYLDVNPTRKLVLHDRSGNVTSEFAYHSLFILFTYIIRYMKRNVDPSSIICTITGSEKHLNIESYLKDLGPPPLELDCICVITSFM